MDQPSDALTKPVRRAPWIITGLAAASIVTAGIIGGPALGAALNPAPSPTPTALAIGEDVAVVDVPVSPNSVEGSQEVAAAQAAKAAADAQAAAEAAAAEAAAAAAQKANATKRSSGASERNLPAGATPPNVPGTDQPDSTACASSALTWNGSASVCA